ncbi:NAD(P)-binding protein [Polychaeton citri CBS 116435]|uniref:NAD(P)-binding protein n=1 Tax=Polychaeton citri CBS 116435 TaxID=1314669 RepID=A0A9P4Q0H1_9PEZI|nr:NAD(P)-binding protein [Polychaeton citri CBS 116435]
MAASSSPSAHSPTYIPGASSARLTSSGIQLPPTTGPPSESDPATPKLWVIFGATGHLGRAVTKAALSHGDSVVAVGRTMENSPEQMQGWHERCLGLVCDVRVRPTVARVYERALDWGKRIDIIVNCTGYGVIGACEDQDSSDLRSQFETNFLGTLNIVQLSLPYFRQVSQQRRNNDENAGRYLIFSSTSGALGVPGLGPYCATKYATEALIESMLYEIDTFGIKATLVEPGHVRLDEPTGLDDKAVDVDIMQSPRAPDGVGKEGGMDGAGARQQQRREMWRRTYGHFYLKPPSKPYSSPNSPAGHAKRVVQWLQDRQPTSAVKSAELVWQLAHCRYPPLRLLLGSYAVESVRDRLKSVTEEIEDWKHLHFPTADEAGLEDGVAGGSSSGGAGNGKERVRSDGEDVEMDDEDEDERDAPGGGMELGFDGIEAG